MFYVYAESPVVGSGPFALQAVATMSILGNRQSLKLLSSKQRRRCRDSWMKWAKVTINAFEKKGSVSDGEQLAPADQSSCPPFGRSLRLAAELGR